MLVLTAHILRVNILYLEKSLLKNPISRTQYLQAFLSGIIEGVSLKREDILKRHSQKLDVLILERKASSSRQYLKHWDICAAPYTRSFNKASRQGEQVSATPGGAGGAFPAARCLSQALGAVSREFRAGGAAARALSRQRRRAGGAQ